MVCSGGKKYVPLPEQRVPISRGGSSRVNQPSMAGMRDAGGSTGTSVADIDEVYGRIPWA